MSSRKAKRRFRNLLLETLEKRQLLTTTPVIMDDGDTGFSQSGAWYENFNGYQGDSQSADYFMGGGTSSWDFSVTPGDYKVAAHWVPNFDPNDAADFDVAGTSVSLDQTFAPDDFSDAGVSWEELATVTVSGNSLLVTLTDDGSGFGSAVADAIRIEPLNTTPPAGNDVIASADPVELFPGIPVTIPEYLGDGDNVAADIDMFQVHLTAGHQLLVDVDAQATEFQSSLSSLQSKIRVFDAGGTEVVASADQPVLVDAQLSFDIQTTGTYYVGISSQENAAYDPASDSSRPSNATLGAYQLHMLASAPSASATYDHHLLVDKGGDFIDQADSYLTLREAIDDASNLSGTVLVEILVTESERVIELELGPLEIDSHVTIQGPLIGSPLVIKPHSTATNGRLVEVDAGFNAELKNIILEDGFTTGDGGAIFVEGNLQLTDSEVRTSDASRGGGFFVADGGQVTLVNSTLADNTASEGGAAFVASGGILLLSNSTLAGNSATTTGDALANSGIVSLFQSTVTDNGLVSTTTAESILNEPSGQFYLRNTLIANNHSVDDVNGTFVSHGFNLVSDLGTASGIDDVGHMRDQVGGVAGNAELDARIGAFHRQGGISRSALLLPDSPAMDAGSSFGESPTDQRGAPRKLDGLEQLDLYDTQAQVDIGATEFGAYIVNMGENDPFDANDVYDALDTTTLGDGVVDADPSAAGVQISLRGVVQELSSLAGWDGTESPDLYEFEGVILFDPNIQIVELSLQGTGDNDSLTGDLDIYGDITVQGRSWIDTDGVTPYFDTHIWGGWTPHVDPAYNLTPLNDRLFHVLPNSGLTVQDMLLYGGRSEEDDTLDSGFGGSILNDGGTLLVNHSQLSPPQGQVYSSENGGIFLYSGSFAELGGGAIYTREGLTELRDSLVNDNESFAGGGVYVESGNLDVTQQTVFDDNIAHEHGGGIYNLAGDVHVTEQSEFINHVMYGSGTGGGISNQPDGYLRIDGESEIAYNVSEEAGIGIKAVFEGVGVFNAGALEVAEGVKFLVNHTASPPDDLLSTTGVAIHNAGLATLNDVLFAGNFDEGITDAHRGTIYNASTGLLMIHDSRISDNSSGHELGGVLYNDNGTMLVESTQIGDLLGIYQNAYSDTTRAIYNNGINAKLTIHDSFIGEDYNFGPGSGLVNASGSVSIIGSTFQNNFSGMDASAIRHDGYHEFISEESLSLVTLDAEVNSSQIEIFVNTVEPLKRFPLPLHVQINDERMTVLELDDFRRSLIVARTSGEEHAVSSDLVTFVDDTQRYLVVGEPEEFAKYQVPFDIVINDEIMTVTDIQDDVLRVERGRDGTTPATHYYPFSVFARSGSLSIIDTSFVGNGPTGQANGSAVQSWSHPLGRETSIENSSFVGNYSGSGVAADVTSGAHNPRVLNPDYMDDPTIFPFWNYEDHPPVYLENTVFSFSQTGSDITNNPTRAIHGVDGPVRSGGNNLIETALVESFALTTPLSASADTLTVSDTYDLPDTPFPIAIGHAVEREWISEFAIVTAVAGSTMLNPETDEWIPAFDLTLNRGANDSIPLEHPVESMVAWSSNGFWDPTDRFGIPSTDTILVQRIDTDEPSGLTALQSTIRIVDPTLLPLTDSIKGRLISPDANGEYLTEDVLIVDVGVNGDPYAIDVQRGVDNSNPIAHATGVELEVYEEVQASLNARLGGLNPAMPGLTNTGESGTLVRPLPNSPLLDRGNDTSFKAFSGKLTSGLAPEFRLEITPHFAVQSTNQDVELASYTFYDSDQIKLTDVSQLPPAPFVLLVGDELMDVLVVDSVENTLDVVRGAYGTEIAEYGAGEMGTYGTPITISLADNQFLVSDAANLPAVPFYLSSGSEIMRVDVVDESSSTITVTRAAISTVAIDHEPNVLFTSDFPDLGDLRLNFQSQGTLLVEPVNVVALRPLLNSLTADADDKELHFANLPDFAADRLLGNTISVNDEIMYVEAVSQPTPTRSYAKVWVTRAYAGTSLQTVDTGTDVSLTGSVYAVANGSSLGTDFYLRAADEVLEVTHASALSATEFTASHSSYDGHWFLAIDEGPNTEHTRLDIPATGKHLAYGHDILAVSGSGIILNVSDTYALPSVPFLVQFGDERFEVTAVDHTLNNVTVTRAAFGTTAEAHPIGRRPHQGNLVTVDDASVLPPSVPYAIRLGTEELVVNAIDLTHNLLVVERSNQSGPPQSHTPDQTFLWGNEDFSAGYHHLPTLVAAPIGSADTQITIQSTATLPQHFELRIHDEEMLVSAALDNGDETWTLTVERGIHGTTPESHVVNSHVLMLVADGNEFRFLESLNEGARSIDIGSTEGQVFTVNTSADSADLHPGDGTVTTATAGEVSLRAAVMEANALPGMATIVIPAGTYTLTSPLTIASHVQVRGAGVTQTTINSTSSRLFDVTDTGTLRLSHLILSGNASGDGGAVHVDGGSLILNTVIATANSAQSGGVVANVGGSVTISTSTLHANTATGMGGAIYNTAGGNVEIRSSTLSGNDATTGGGAIYSDASSSVALYSSTIADNDSSNGTGGVVALGSNTLANTLLATNTSSFQASDLEGSFLSLDGNLVGAIPDSPYTLAADITHSDLSLTINQTTDLPPTPFVILIESEQLLVTEVDGTTLTVTRGHNSTAAVSHFATTEIRTDGIFAAADQHGTTSMPLDPLIAPLTAAHNDLPMHALTLASPAIDAAVDSEDATAQIFTVSWGYPSNERLVIANPEGLPEAPFDILADGLTRTVQSVDGNEIWLNEPLFVPVDIPITVLTDGRGAPRAFATDGSGGSGGSGGGGGPGGGGPGGGGPGGGGGGSGGGGSGGGSGGSGLVDVGAFELVPIIDVSTSTPSLVESDAGITQYQFTVTRSAYTVGELSIPYIVHGVGAHRAEASDFDGGLMPVGTIDFEDGDQSIVVTFDVAGDTSLEHDETFEFRLLHDASIEVLSPAAEATIENNDTVTLTASSPVVVEGRGLLFDVTLSGTAEDGIWVEWNIDDDTATTSDSDYVDNDGYLFFNGTDLESNEFLVRTVSDDTVESDELLDTSLSLATGIERASDVTFVNGTGTITNDDTGVVPDGYFTVSSVDLSELNSTHTFAVTFNGTVSGPVSVTVDAESLTAKTGQHLNATATVLNFSGTSGETLQYSVDVVNEPEFNFDRGYEVVLSGVSAGSHTVDASMVGEGNILNDDPAWAYAADPCGSDPGGGGGGGSGGGDPPGGPGGGGTGEDWPVPDWVSISMQQNEQRDWDAYYNYTDGGSNVREDELAGGFWPMGDFPEDTFSAIHTCPGEEEEEIEEGDPAPVPVTEIETEWVVPFTQSLTFNPFVGHDYRRNAKVKLAFDGDTQWAGAGTSLALEHGSVTVNDDMTLTYTPNASFDYLIEKDAHDRIVRFTNKEKFDLHLLDPDELSQVIQDPEFDPQPYETIPVEIMVSNHLPTLRGDYMHSPDPSFGQFELDSPIFVDFETTNRIDLRDIFTDMDGPADLNKLQIIEVEFSDVTTRLLDEDDPTTTPQNEDPDGDPLEMRLVAGSTSTTDRDLIIRKSPNSPVLEVHNSVSQSDVGDPGWTSGAITYDLRVRVSDGTPDLSQPKEDENGDPDGYELYEWDVFLDVNPRNMTQHQYNWHVSTSAPETDFRPWVSTVTPDIPTRYPNATTTDNEPALSPHSFQLVNTQVATRNSTSVGSVDVDLLSGDFRRYHSLIMDGSGGASELAIPGLVYDSATNHDDAAPTPVVRSTLLNYEPAVESVNATLTWHIDGTTFGNGSWAWTKDPNSTDPTPTEFNIAISPSEYSHHTGVHGWELDVTITDDQGNTVDLHSSGESVVVAGEHNQFLGAGWAFQGVPSLAVDLRTESSNIAPLNTLDDRIVLAFPGAEPKVFNAVDLTLNDFNYDGELPSLQIGSASVSSDGFANALEFGTLTSRQSPNELVYDDGSGLEYIFKQYTDDNDTPSDPDDDRVFYLIDRIEQPEVEFDTGGGSWPNPRRGVSFVWDVSTPSEPTITSITASDGTVTNFAYDTNGHLDTQSISGTSGLVYEVDYTISVDGELQEIRHKLNPGGASAAGDRVRKFSDQIVDNGGNVLHDYDGRLATDQWLDGSGTLHRHTEFWQEGTHGSLSKIQFGDGDGTLENTIVYEVQAARDSNVAEFSIEATDLKKYVHGTGAQDSSGTSRTEFTFGQDGRLEQRESFFEAQSLSTDSYAYDHLGLLKIHTDQSGDTYYWRDYEIPIDRTDDDPDTEPDDGPIYDPDDFRGNVTYSLSQGGFNRNVYETDDETNSALGKLVTSYQHTSMDAAGDGQDGGPAQELVSHFVYAEDGRLESKLVVRGAIDAESSEAIGQDDYFELWEYSGGFLSKHTDTRGLVTDYTYSTTIPSRLESTTVTNVYAGNTETTTTSLTYDALGLLDTSTTAIDGTNLSVHDSEYDATGQLIKQEVFDGSSNLLSRVWYVYTPDGLLFDTITPAPNGSTDEIHSVAFHDRAGLLMETTTGLLQTPTLFGSATEASHYSLYADSDLSLAETTEFEYYSNGMLYSTDLADGNVQYHYHDPSTRKSWTKSTGYSLQAHDGARGSNDQIRVIEREYDEHGRTIATGDLTGTSESSTTHTSPVNAFASSTTTHGTSQLTAKHTNNAVGQLQTSESFGRTDEFKYDDFGRLSAVADLDNDFEKASSIANAAGDVLKTTEARKFGGLTQYFRTNYELDQLGRQRKVIDPLTYGSSSWNEKGAVSATVSYSVDAGMAKVTNTSRAGLESHQWLDALGRVKKEQSVDGSMTYYEYDLAGNQTQVHVDPVDGKDLTIDRRFDALSRTRVTTYSSTAADFKPYFEAVDYFRTGQSGGTDEWNEVRFIPLEIIGTLDITDESTYQLPDSHTSVKHLSTRTRYDIEGKPFYIQAPDPTPGGSDTPTTVIEYVTNQSTGETTITTTLSVAANADNEYGGIDLSYPHRRISKEVKNELGQTILTSARVSDTNPDATTSEAAYDPVSGKRISSKDLHGNETLYEYDRDGNVTKVTNALGHSSTKEYDSSGNLRKETDANGNSTRYYYDALGRRTGVRDALGRMTELMYADGGLTQTVTNARDFSTTTYTFPLVRTQVVGAPEGITTTTVFDSSGNALHVTNIDGKGTQRQYDALGRVVASGVLGGTLSTFVYDVRGNLISETDPRGNTTTHEYDVLNRRTSTTNADNTETKTTYDVSGNVLKVETYDAVPALIAKSTFAYDGLNRQTKSTIYPDASSSTGQTTETEYDDDANTRYVKDPLNHTVEYVYDGAGQLDYVLEWSNGATTMYGYDPAGNRTTLTDPELNVTTWTYTALNQINSVKNANNETRSYEYDKAGNLERYTDRNGRVTKYEYDEANRRTHEKWLNAAGTVEHTITTAYDTSNRVNSVSDTNATIAYGNFDLANRPRSMNNDIARPAGATSIVGVVMQDFDAAGNRSFVDVTVSIDGNTTTVHAFRNDYSYDALNLMKTIVQSGANVADKWIGYEYDALGQIKVLDRRLGATSSSDHVIKANYDFDDAGRLEEIDYQDPGATPSLATYGWEYDAAGRLTKLTSPDGTVDYGYDGTNQLTSEIITPLSQSGDPVQNISYAYDTNGNRTSVTADGETIDYSTTPNNELSEQGDYTYEYDAEGNRIKRTKTDENDDVVEVLTYEWDHRNRLVLVSEFPDDVETDPDKTVEYAYDPLNRRVARRVDDDGAGSNASVDTYFLNEGDRAARDGAGDHVVVQLGDNGDITNRYLHGAAIDLVLADEDDAGDILWPLTDNLGSVRDLAEYDAATDETDVVNHIVYDAFGVVSSESDDTVDHLFGYTGREFDDEVDLQYNRARYYDASVGRWISPDPIGFQAGDANLYRYVGNHGTYASDPSGLDEIDVSRPTVEHPGLSEVVGQWSDWWNNNGRVSWQGQENWAIGQRKGDWVYFTDGGRATFTAVSKAAASFDGANYEDMIDAIRGIKSPFKVNAQSDQIGVFLGGTNQHIHDIGNVERMYNLFTGTKFYHGGIGHPVDYMQETISQGNAWGFQAGIDRALKDVLDQYEPGKKISIYGWSRGAAQGIELARELGKRDIPVEFLGLFDPVYSVTSAGHGSAKVRSSEEGINGNYVEVSTPRNVNAATVIYAMNEDRSWFPATWLRENGRTTLTLIASPGAHGEVGGHWESSMPIQQLNLRTMIEFARGHGNVRLKFTGIDSEIHGILNSTFGRQIALRNYVGKLNHITKLIDWEIATRVEHWSPFTKEEFRQQLNSTTPKDWAPGGFGTQNWDVVNLIWFPSQVGPPLPYAPPLGELITGKQPIKDHYPRTLPWVQLGLWDVYDNESNSKNFIESLYQKTIHPRRGGWKNE